ncbi:MAG: amidohydrolase family protein [Pseudomonadota bacterium]
MDAHNVPTACVVQRGHIYGYDNSYIIDSGKKYPGRLLPVVILDTQHPDTVDQYTRMVRQDGVRGLRLANTRPSHLDTAWLSSPNAMKIWQACVELNTPVALIIFYNQLSYVLPLLHIIAKLHPRLPIVIDHLGTPYCATLVELAWAKEAGIAEVSLPPPPDFGIEATIGRFADTPNVYFKFTEVNIENLHRSGIDSSQLIRSMADRFGANRLVWGSDIGQSLRWDFAEKASMARAACSLLTATESRLFLHDNAAHLYDAAGKAAR